MSRLSQKTRERLKDAILSVLYEKPFTPMFTHSIANEIIRDKELTLRLLTELKEKGIVKQQEKDNRGRLYRARKKWVLLPEVIKAFNRKFEETTHGP